MHIVVGSMLVHSPSPETSPLARNHRSESSSSGSTREEGDDRWGRAVSDRGFKMDFLFFKNG